MCLSPGIMMSTFPACVVCSKQFQYQGPDPHLLPCLHAVCKPCLDSPTTSSVTCSICNRNYERDGQPFPVDQVTLSEVLHLVCEHRPNQIFCTNKEDGHQAVCWCSQCKDFLCEHCQISHTEVKATRNHKLSEMTEISKLMKHSALTCMEHGSPLNIYDETCDRFICNQCYYKDHNSHATVTSEDFAGTEEENQRDNVEAVSDKNKDVLASTDEVNAHGRTLEEKSTQLRDMVDHTFSELQSVVAQREKVIQLELDELMECTTSFNNSRHPVLKATNTSCETTLDYINKSLMYTSPEHQLLLKKSLNEATQYCVSSTIPTVHKYEASLSFCKQGLHDIKSAVSTFGSFLAPISESGQPDEFTPLQSGKDISSMINPSRC